jgi:hypothetical protein
MGSFEACGAASGKSQASGSPRNPSAGAASRVDLGGQVGWAFPAALQAFDRHRSGAFEDVTGVSLPDGEPPVFGTP